MMEKISFKDNENQTKKEKPKKSSKSFFTEMDPREFKEIVGCKNYYVTNSGRFLIDNKSNPMNYVGDSSTVTSSYSPRDNFVTSTLMNLLNRSASSYSVPSAFVNKDCLKKLYKNQNSKPSKHHNNTSDMTLSRSISMQELRTWLKNGKNIRGIKNNKMLVNRDDVDASTRMTDSKAKKEYKNKIVKKELEDEEEENDCEKFTNRTENYMTPSCTSYFLHEVNLESEECESDDDVDNGYDKFNKLKKAQIYSLLTADLLEAPQKEPTPSKEKEKGKEKN